ncbi:coiled-coil domain-containing protein 74A [Colossoma macropomum]|uniref:coiled-coil domain-containing protein 74A n=1 Tax=Colossoma macropomum TaxID=42526 RepID=UPI00186537F0|nr:coiled-coil domain-containing protein 74A [Colossoma macropomum]
MSNVMSTSSLPPLRNLPSWSRVGILDRARYPRLFPSDCVHEGPASDRDGQKISQSKAVMDGARVASLEKDILFLQQTHKSTLEKLHEEIESLKRTNKELQYRLIMDSHPYPPRDSNAGGLHEKHSQTGFISSQEKLDTANHNVEQYGGIITSLLPLKIHSGQSRPPRTPTLQECEAIIRQLYNTNTLQSQELLQVKAMLKDIVLNKKKISPEVSTLTKAYLSDSTSSGEHFPKLPLRPLPKIQQPSQTSVRERVILPAIRQSLRSSMTERQKRAQDVHKTRLRRAVNS